MCMKLCDNVSTILLQWIILHVSLVYIRTPMRVFSPHMHDEGQMKPMSNSVILNTSSRVVRGDEDKHKEVA